MPLKPPIFGLLAEFDGADTLIEAVRRARTEGYSRMDAHSPYPLEGAAAALGFHHTAIPLVVFFGGLFGCAFGFAMQYWCAVIDYPINVGGRPLNSWPSFIPVTFELTILTASLAGLIGLLALCGLPRLYHPVFNVPAFDRATRDRFFLCIEATDPHFDRQATRDFLGSLNALGVEEVPH